MEDDSNGSVLALVWGDDLPDAKGTKPQPVAKQPCGSAKRHCGSPKRHCGSAKQPKKSEITPPEVRELRMQALQSKKSELNVHKIPPLALPDPQQNHGRRRHRPYPSRSPPRRSGRSTKSTRRRVRSRSRSRSRSVSAAEYVGPGECSSALMACNALAGYGPERAEELIRSLPEAQRLELAGIGYKLRWDAWDMRAQAFFPPASAFPAPFAAIYRHCRAGIAQHPIHPCAELSSTEQIWLATCGLRLAMLAGRHISPVTGSSK